MRVRELTAAGLAVACIAGLAACRTNVGEAASLNGHRITESDVSKYLTPTAEAVPQTDSTTGAALASIPARSWVLRTLLNAELYSEVLARTPTGTPSTAQIAASQTALLQGTTLDAVVLQYVAHGYKPAFARLFVHEQSIEQILGGLIQAGLDANKILGRIGVHASVNPRYGAWDPKTYQLSTAANAGLPSYLTLKPDYVEPDLGSAEAPTN